MTRTTSRIAMALLTLVAAPVAGLDLSTAAERQTPGITSTSPELERRDRAVTADDLRILTRAAVLLKDESGWNRADDRDCKDDEATGKRSLFCALQKACIDVLGRYDHRRAALQEVVSRLRTRRVVRTSSTA